MFGYICSKFTLLRRADSCSIDCHIKSNAEDNKTPSNKSNRTMGSRHSSVENASRGADSANCKLEASSRSVVESETIARTPRTGKRGLNVTPSAGAPAASKDKTVKPIRNGSLKLKSALKLPCKSTTDPKKIIAKVMNTVATSHHSNEKHPSGQSRGVKHNPIDQHPQRNSSDHNRSAVTIAPVEKPPDPKQQHYIHEKRRDSLRNGDVFIYPPIYRRLNECRKCSRDNKICNCNKTIAEQPSNEEFEEASNNRPIDQDPNCLHGESGTLIQSPTSDKVVGANTRHQPNNCDDQSQSLNRTNKANNRRPPPVPPRSNLTAIERRRRSVGGEPQVVSTTSVDPVVGDFNGPTHHMCPRAAQIGTGSSSKSNEEQTVRAKSSTGSTQGDTVDANCGMKIRDSGLGSESSCSSLSDSLRGSFNARKTGEKNRFNQPNVDSSSFLRSSPTEDNHIHSDWSPITGNQTTLIGGGENDTSRSSEFNTNYTTSRPLIKSNELEHRESAVSSFDQNNNELSTDSNSQSSSQATHGARLDSKSESCDMSSEVIISTASTTCDANLTSIVPIQNISTRRKNMASKLSRQAIYEDYDEDQFVVTKLATLETGTTPAEKLVIIPEPLAIESKQIDLIGCDAIVSSCVDDLGYSPILSSVRDYIENVNTELLKTSTTPDNKIEFPTISSTIIEGSPGSLASCSQSFGSAGSSSNTITLAAQSSNSIETIQAIGSVSNSLEPMIATTTIITTPSTVVMPAIDLLDSTKKSIFDGASKDEILEYLEDARERVPEVLIAADDVMVISGNELIVVNQLEPNSPATPISILETSEILGGRTIESPCASSIISEALTGVSRADDFVDGGAGSTQANWHSTQLDSNCDSFDVVNSNQDTSINQSMCSSNYTSGNLKNFSFRTDTTIDSLDDQAVGGDSFNELGIASDSPSIGEERERQIIQQHLKQYQRSSLRRQLIKDQSTSSNASNKSLSDTSNASGPTRVPFGIQRAPIYGGRRNSTSGGTSALDRDRTLKMMRVGRDSLSSSSSSPPSSSSPSSSNSSNRTSGECSAGSNFYASLSLSSSSPFIALNRMSPCSPAFGRSVTPIGLTEVKCHNHSRAVGEAKNSSSSAERAIIDESGKAEQNLEKVAAPNVLETAAPELCTSAGELRENPEGPSRADLTSSHVKDIAELNKCIDLLERESKILASQGAVTDRSSQVDTNKSYDTKVHISANLTTPAARMTGSLANSGVTGCSGGILQGRTSHGHHATITRLNNYFINRQIPPDTEAEVAVDFQCLDCDQFILADQAILMHKTNELRQLRTSVIQLDLLNSQDQSRPLSSDQLDRAYIAAMNGLPLCKSCDKKRIERKEIISEFVETELKYGRDLKIIHDEFYRPMQIAGLLSKDQINGIFLNLDELIMAHCRFADRLGIAINEARAMGDQDYNTVNIGKIFVESAEMLHTFESYCVRQGSAACLLARLAKEKELLRIFLRVSQMENTLLRRMNLAAFLMVPVQRVTKYPLLLNRLYKVTAYHHKDREALRDAQLKVELHLEHINQQTKGVGASNKIWRRISNLSAPISAHRRGLVNAEDIGYMKLRKTAMDMLKWNRDETQFIHSGKINFAPLNEHLTKQKMKPIRHMPAHALLIVLGKPNWKYRPDLVKATLDSKLMIPTPDGNGIKEAALLLFREKNNRFVPCREPLFLSNCVLSNDCSQYNSECPPLASASTTNVNKLANQSTSNGQSAMGSGGTGASYCGAARRSISGSGDSRDHVQTVSSAFRPASAELTLSQQQNTSHLAHHHSVTSVNSGKASKGTKESAIDSRFAGDNHSMSSLKSLPENRVDSMTTTCSPPVQAPRSFSLASALPRTPITTGCPPAPLNKSASSTSSNLTILNQLMTKVNSYHKQTASSASKSIGASALEASKVRVMSPTSGDNVDSGLGKQPSAQREVTVAADTQIATNGDHCHSRSSSLSLTSNSLGPLAEVQQLYYNHHYYHNHHQPYGDYEESFEIHERLTKESMLLKADTPLKTRYWLQILRYHAKDLGQWRSRRNALSNIMMMRHDKCSPSGANDCIVRSEAIGSYQD